MRFHRLGAALGLTLALMLLLPLGALGENKQVTITFLGDCTIGGEEWMRSKPESFDAYLERYGAEYFFQKVQSVIADDDLTVANLEGVFSDSTSGKVEKTYNFRAPTSYTKVLTSSSVECVSVANNHTMDYSEIGVRRTAKALDGAGIQWFGNNIAFQKTWIYEKDGVKIGFLAMEGNYRSYGQSILERQLRQLKRDGCEAIVACVHGGAEYSANHNVSQSRPAHWLIKNGCSVVIFHHPHVLQGVEVYNNATICYSLGNFVFGGNASIKKTRARYSAMFQFTFSFDGKNRYLGHQLNIIPVFVSSDPEKNTYQPYPVTGKNAKTVLDVIQQDTGFPLKPYQKKIGAIQDFVPFAEEKKNAK